MSYLQLAKKIQAEIKPAQSSTAEPGTIDGIVDENVVAVLIDSTILGAPVWFALQDGWQPKEADGVSIFYASELPALRQKTPEQLRSIFNVKLAFGGGMVRQ